MSANAAIHSLCAKCGEKLDGGSMLLTSDRKLYHIHCSPYEARHSISLPSGKISEAMWLENAMRQLTRVDVAQYLLSNTRTRSNGALKANAHASLTISYVAVIRGIDPDRVRRRCEADYQAVHDSTAEQLTSKLDQAIGFDLDACVDDDVAERFFKAFHRIALAALSVPTPGTGGADKWLGELLAIIHRDGGQYQAMHGLEKAVEDAHSIIAAAFSTPQGGYLGAAKVKPLEWSEGSYRSFIAETIIGPYAIKDFGFEEYSVIFDGATIASGYRNINEAKATALEHFSSRILSALSSTPVGEMDGWQPIETAPKDGSKFLAYEKGRYFDCWWHENGYGEAYWMDEADSEPNPSDWQPLPTSPQGGR